MPLEIKNKRTGEVSAHGVMGNSLRCGHCDQEILHDTTWIALDDPYFCLIHETCLSMFEFNGLSRTVKGLGRKGAQQEMDEIVRDLETMLSRPWFQRRGVPTKYQRALQQLLMVHQSLRTSGVVGDDVMEKTRAPSEEIKKM